MDTILMNVIGVFQRTLYHYKKEITAVLLTVAILRKYKTRVLGNPVFIEKSEFFISSGSSTQNPIIVSLSTKQNAVGKVNRR